MRLTLLMFLMVGCAPDSHVLLSSGADGGADGHDGSGPWTDCDEARGEGSMGDACDFTNACGGEGDAVNVAVRCLRGELLVTTTTRSGPAGECSDDPVETMFFDFEPTGRPSPGCLSGWVCTEVGGHAFTLCQVEPRLEVRDGSPPPHTDCGSSVASGRDGDACVGDFSCGVHNVDGHDQIGWCDGGILRLAPPYGLSNI